MAWHCKLCPAFASTKSQLYTHIRLQHSQFSRVSPLPCLYDSCICTFTTLTALSTHLSRYHTSEDTKKDQRQDLAIFKCSLCAFQHFFSEPAVLCHIRGHLKKHEMVTCPFKDCNYRTNVYSSFNSHKCRMHSIGLSSDSCENVVGGHVENPEPSCSNSDLDMENESLDQTSEVELGELYDVTKLKSQLKHNLTSLFLKMQTILHISNTAVQEIVETLNHICSLSQPIIKEAVKSTLLKYGHDVSNSTLNEVVGTVMDSMVLYTETSKGSDLSTNKRRKSFIEQNYPVVKPIEYSLGDGRAFMYVPLLQTIQELLKATDVLKNVGPTPSEVGTYTSYRDSRFFLENDLLNTDELTLALQLYVDDLEIANALGTSRKVHKICAFYWVLANLPAKYRSAMHTIQLALLAKTTDVQKYGYAAILAPLMSDVQILEQDGVFIESLGQNVKGTLFCVSADNLAAHGLGGFVESFSGEYVCRFCLGTSQQIQESEVCDEVFTPRTKESHDLHVKHMLESDMSASTFGVKGSCVLRESLKYFHPISGFAPDLLHDLMEGIVPVELALCLKEMIRLKHFSLQYLNQKILTFKYKNADKVDRPQAIPQSFKTRGTIGGNGHENATLLRLLPLLVGSKVPVGDAAWTVLMDLKDVLELALCPSFTDGLLEYFVIKISDHRQALQDAFPNFRLRPKHHYVEHYPELIKCFGPLVNVWTMRFEAKHRFFKRAVRDSQNFKNVLKTLANKHQYSMAYHLTTPTYFKPEVQGSRVESILVSALPEVAQTHIKEKTNSDTIYHTAKVTIDGIEYARGMFVSAKSNGGLPMFSEINDIYLVNNTISFLCCDFQSWFTEHLRSFELTPLHHLSVYLQSDFNDTAPLSAYSVDGVLLLTPKRFIRVKE